MKFSFGVQVLRGDFFRNPFCIGFSTQQALPRKAFKKN